MKATNLHYCSLCSKIKVSMGLGRNLVPYFGRAKHQKFRSSFYPCSPNPTEKLATRAMIVIDESQGAVSLEYGSFIDSWD